MKRESILVLVAVLLALSPLVSLALGKWVEYWRLVMNLGDEPAYIAMAILLYYLVDQRVGITVLLALATSAWVNVFAKNTLRLPRPPRELWLAEADGYGFPSGHTQTSTTFWASLSLETRRVGVYVLGATIVGVVGLSRLLLNVHYPRDVIGGLVLGLVASIAVYFAGRKISLKPREAALVLLAYGAAVALLYFFQQDAYFLRLGGLIVGLAVYPIGGEKIDLRGSDASRRVPLAILALVIAFSLTQLAKSQLPVLQFFLYLVTGLATVSIPALKTIGRRVAAG
ncbi:MAG: phosphatase PAP2 family protein [Thermofilum sp.]|nr:phosphatase PAP2 family protein [Thermofilum sp.]